MKTLKLFGLVLFFFGTAQAAPPGHDPAHVKHNMVIYGDTQIFASHIVYKDPHNLQVILRVDFEPRLRELYLKERRAHPQDGFILLLNEMNLKQIATMTTLTGTLFRVDPTGRKITLTDAVRLKRPAFNVIYFAELPLSLRAD